MSDPRRLEREVKRLQFELSQAVRVLPHLRQMVEFSGDVLLLLDAELRVLESNGRLATMLGVPAASLYQQPLGRWLAIPQQAEVLAARLHDLQSGSACRMEVELQAPDGVLPPMELVARRLTLPSGVEDRWTVSLRDISERRRLQSSQAMLEVQSSLIDQLRSSEERYRQLVEQLGDGLALLDLGLVFQFANPATHRIFALPEGQLEGRGLGEFVAEQDRGTLEQLSGALLAAQSRQFRLQIVDGLGSTRVLDVELTPRLDPEGVHVGSSLMVRDITELSAARLELERLAFNDVLTGLGNEESSRRFLEDRLGRRIDRHLTLLWLDLDGFRRVNHTFGRATGDHLLWAVADHLRRWKQPGDWLARLGGDEFLVIRPGCDAMAAETMAAELQASISRNVFLPQGEELVLGFCGGLSVFPDHGQEADVLLRRAATALSQAHDQGQGQVVLYEMAFTDRLRAELDLEGKLRLALENGQLHLNYQPQVDGQGQLIGYEALVRWRDGDHGLVSPGQFIPIAEKTGLIHSLGRWVVEEACRQQRQWLEEGLNPRPMAVNVSPRQFPAAPPLLSRIVAEVLQRHDLPASLLELEITESCLLPISGLTQELEDLAALGLTLAIDDFGTGYSSLTYLHRLPIQKLKIDQSFVTNLEQSPSARLIVQTAIAMGKGLGLKTMVEGVETQSQASLLASLGCDGYQGYYFARPMEAHQLAALLRDGSSLPLGS